MDIVGTTTVCGGICILETSGIVPLGVVICTRASEHTRPHFGTFFRTKQSVRSIVDSHFSGMLAVVCAASRSCCQPWKHVECEQLLFRLGDGHQLLFLHVFVF